MEWVTAGVLGQQRAKSVTFISRVGLVADHKAGLGPGGRAYFPPELALDRCGKS